MLWGTLLLWLHLGSLALGGAATFGIPVVMMRAAREPAPEKASFGKAVESLSKVGMVAIVLIVLTGVALVLAGPGGLAGMGLWFWIKMLLVVLFIGNVLYSRANGLRARAGDSAAMALAPKLGLAGMALLLAIVGAAVLAFG